MDGRDEQSAPSSAIQLAPPAKTANRARTSMCRCDYIQRRYRPMFACGAVPCDAHGSGQQEEHACRGRQYGTKRIQQDYGKWAHHMKEIGYLPYAAASDQRSSQHTTSRDIA